MPMDSRKKKRIRLDEEEAVVAGDISVLGDDLLHEILLRLPPSSLVNSISVSRSLLRVCNSPLFRLHYQSRRASYLLGFFVNQNFRRISYIPISSSSTAVSERNTAYILDSRGGWLLVADLYDFSVRLFHPIFNETAAMVKPSLHNNIFSFCALLPNPSSSNPRCPVRILRVLTKPSIFPIIQIFSPETPGEWKKIQSSRKINIGHCYVRAHPVLVNEFVHWLKGDHQILVLNANSYDLSLLGLPRGIPRGLPRRFTNHWLGKFKNQLCYAYLKKSELYIWVLVDQLRCEWHLEHQLDLGKFPELSSHSDRTRFLAIGIGGSLNAIFQGWMGKIFSLDLINEELREIGIANFKVRCVFPYIYTEAD